MGNRYGNRKITSARSQAQERKIRDARKNPFPEFANETPAVDVENLSKDLLLCNRCGLRKPDEEFHKKTANVHRRQKDTRCKQCKTEISRKYWEKITPEQKKKKKISGKKSYEKHKKERIAWQRDYERKRIKEYKGKNPMNKDIDAAWERIKSGNINCGDFELIEKALHQMRDAQSVDVAVLKIKAHKWWIDNHRQFPNGIELLSEYVDHLHKSGHLQLPVESADVEGLLFCTQRHCEDEIHIECRFENGEKYAAVIVDIDKPELADSIEKFLNTQSGHLQPRVDGWQPIETAPKDGTSIVIASNRRSGAFINVESLYWSGFDNEWFLWCHEEDPTHWMPLPPLPKQVDEG